MNRVNSNLDRIVAEVGFELADNNKHILKEFERIVTKALGILIEDGPLAYAIWLESEGNVDIIDSSFKLLREKAGVVEGDYGNPKSSEKLRKAILNEIAIDVKKTLLARQLLERMLIYARYRAKALQKGETE